MEYKGGQRAAEFTLKYTPLNTNQTASVPHQSLQFQYKRLRPVESPIEEGLPQLPNWRKMSSSTESEEGSTKDRQTDCVLIYPRIKWFQDRDEVSSSDSDSELSVPKRCNDNKNARPQVIVEHGNASRRLKSSQRELQSNLNNRPGVIVAAASSSSIGDLSINDDLGEVTVKTLVEKSVFPRPIQEPIGMLFVTATDATSENAVSSTSEGDTYKAETFGVVKRTPYAGTFQTSTHRFDFIPTAVSRGRVDHIVADENLGSSSPLEFDGIPSERPGEPNGNWLKLYTSVEFDDADNEEVGGGGEDDDSTGVILKDETDSAEEEVGSADELTDSASETGGGVGVEEPQRTAKPVITISDQNFPRLVIDFGVEEDAIHSCQHDADSIGRSNYIPIQNWLENSQRFNKRKRTDSERLDDKP